VVDNGVRPLTRRRLRYEVPMTKYLLLALIVFAINLLPAFGPPTWTIIVYAHLRWSLNPVVLVSISAPWPPPVATFWPLALGTFVSEYPGAIAKVSPLLRDDCHRIARG